MKKLRTLFLWCLSLCLALTVLVPTALAADTISYDLRSAGQKDGVFTVEPGGSIEVTLYVCGTAEVGSFQNSIPYNRDLFTLEAGASVASDYQPILDKVCINIAKGGENIQSTEAGAAACSFTLKVSFSNFHPIAPGPEANASGPESF